jgi:iron complex transport system substrate-binding protein
MGLIFLYTLAPETLVGTPINFSPAVKRFLLPEMADLPNLGGQQSGARLNPEAVISAGTQLFLSMTSSIPGKGDAADADALQAQINAPVYVMNGSIEMFAENYRVFGKILGRGERAEELANYCDNVLSDVTAKVSRVQADKRIRLYYAQGHDCLATEPEDSMHAEVFKYANARNVADVGNTAVFGMTQVSMEQLLRWNPEIIAAQAVCYPKIMSDPDWSAISAVKNGRVYLIPDLPFSWVDRPPSVNRFLGIQWAANLLYPELYDIDIARTAQEFYRLFYHIDVGTDEIRKLGTVE